MGRRIWTKETLLARGVEWARDNGRLPSARDGCVSEATVRRLFGSWNAYKKAVYIEAPDRSPDPAQWHTRATHADAVNKAHAQEMSDARKEIFPSRDTNPKLTILVPDIHFSHHCPTSVEVAKKAIEMLRPCRIVQMGDIMDCEIWSSFEPRSVSEVGVKDFMSEEVAPAREFTDYCLRYAKTYSQLEGNHEERITRVCAGNGSQGLAVHSRLSAQSLLGDGRGKEWDWTPYRQSCASYCRINPWLIAVHGWSFAASAALVHLRASRSQSIAFGHTHRAESVTSRDIFQDNRYLSAFSFGTLSELQPLYAMGGSKPTDWVNGFCLVYSGSMSFTHYTVLIQNGAAVLPDGREVRV